MLALDDVVQARNVIQGMVQRTPLIHSHILSQRFGCQLFLKAENLQHTGSFKVRGAYNKIITLARSGVVKGIIAASAGNHAQGVAVAAAAADIPATIVMPETASLPKVQATQGYGARVILYGENYEEAAAHTRHLAQEEGLTVIPAFNDDLVVAGQGTIGLEVHEALPDLDAVIVPVGGGGLISGIALAVKSLRPATRVIGVQASAATGAKASFQEGRIVHISPRNTLADGIAVGAPGEVTLPLMQRYVDDIVSVEEEAISQAMVLLLEFGKLVVEGAGAVGVAALLSGRLSCKNQKTVAILSGGNVDVNLIARVVEHGLTLAGRYLIIRVKLPDRPGQLARLVDLLAAIRVNVLDIDHFRTGIPLPLGEVEVQLTLETRDAAHAKEVCRHLQEHGYEEASFEGRPGVLGAGFPSANIRYFVPRP